MTKRESTNANTEATPRQISVTLSTYEGDDFPDADDLFEDYVLAELTRQHPGARIGVSTAQGSTRALVDGEPDAALASEIGGDWWSEFCASSEAATDTDDTTSLAIGDRVEGGQPGTEDHDTGKVIAVDGNQIRVAWDSQVTTWCGPGELRTEGESEANYAVLDRDTGLRYDTTSSTSLERIERELARIMRGPEAQEFPGLGLGIGRINPDGNITDVTDEVRS